MADSTSAAPRQRGHHIRTTANPLATYCGAARKDGDYTSRFIFDAADKATADELLEWLRRKEVCPYCFVKFTAVSVRAMAARKERSLHCGDCDVYFDTGEALQLHVALRH